MNKIKTKLKVDDTVVVLSGKDAGKTGKIVKIDREKGRVIVAGVNLVKKTFRPRNEQEQGGIREVEASLAISNVAYQTKSGPSKLGFEFKDGKKVRVAKKTGEVINE